MIRTGRLRGRAMETAPRTTKNSSTIAALTARQAGLCRTGVKLLERDVAEHLIHVSPDAQAAGGLPEPPQALDFVADNQGTAGR